MSDDYIRIPLSLKSRKYRGMYEAVVDKEDDDLQHLRWHVRGAKWHNKYLGNKTVYADTGFVLEDGKTWQISMHRIIMQRIMKRPLFKGEIVDHIDGDGLNNRRTNLRIVTHSQSMHNTDRPLPKSGHRGVTWIAGRKRWRAKIWADGKAIHLGHFKTLEEAVAAYKAAVEKYIGEYSYLNSRKTDE